MPRRPYIRAIQDQVDAWSKLETKLNIEVSRLEGLIRTVTQSDLSAEDRDAVNRVLSEAVVIKRDTLRQLKPALREARQSLVKGPK